MIFFLIFFAIYFSGFMAMLVIHKCYKRSNTYNACLDMMDDVFPMPQVMWPLALVCGLGYLFVAYVLAPLYHHVIDTVAEAITNLVCPNRKREE